MFYEEYSTEALKWIKSPFKFLSKAWGSAAVRRFEVSVSYDGNASLLLLTLLITKW